MHTPADREKERKKERESDKKKSVYVHCFVLQWIMGILATTTHIRGVKNKAINPDYFVELG